MDPFVRNLPDPERGRLRLTRWLEDLSSTETGFAQLEAVPVLAETFALLLSASSDVAAMVKRNPELGLSALDLDTDYVRASVQDIRDEARRLAQHTVSFAHRLDRLRFLKDKRTLLLAMCDVGAFLPPPVIWGSISRLAEALILEAADAVWAEMAPRWNLPTQRPVGIIGFGKLGGEELNYSSDVDLSFVVPDDFPEEQLEAVGKFCERYRAAVSEKMGRGSLYRVDLRLRPFGTQGPVVNPLSVTIHYYERYAEPWEHLALIRSRVLDGWPGLNEAWEDLRDRVAFSARRGEWVLDNLRDLRARTMEFGGDDDLKRGRGGIRDVEFLAQVNQLLLGGRNISLRQRHTLVVLRSLLAVDRLTEEEAHDLAEGYTFLRQVEHRCQLREGQQTHRLPADSMEQTLVAATLGLGSKEEMLSRLDDVRRRTHQIYSDRLPNPGTVQVRTTSRELETWISRLPQPEAYFESLAENAHSQERLERLVRFAPTLVAEFATSASLTEEIMSGEVLEDSDVAAHVLRAPKLREGARKTWLRLAARWALAPDDHVAHDIGQRARAIAQRLCQGLDLTVIALGSWANGELTWRSDLDVLLFGEEQAAREFVARADGLHTEGGFFRIDTRLRPDGRKGSLATTIERIAGYAHEMAPWERFAFSQAVLVQGSQGALNSLNQAACVPLSGPEFQQLFHIYQRISSERTSVEGRRLSLKLAEGGLNDCQWAIHLAEVCGDSFSISSQMPLEQRAASAELAHAHRVLMRLRHGVGLLDPSSDFLPDKGDKLSILAELLGLTPGGLLEQFESAKAVVRVALADQWSKFLGS